MMKSIIVMMTMMMILMKMEPLFPFVEFAFISSIYKKNLVYHIYIYNINPQLRIQ